VFTFIQYGTYDICPGPVFRCEFNGGVRFVIRLTIFGNFLKCAIYTSLGSVFQHEFNDGVRFVIRLTIFGNFSKWAIYTVIYSAPRVIVHSMQTVWSPCESVCTPHGLCRVSQSVQTLREFGMSAWTLHKNCTQQGLNQPFNNRTNSSYEMPTLPLYHCGLPHLANLCYM
jgi:hypothetical protein